MLDLAYIHRLPKTRPALIQGLQSLAGRGLMAFFLVAAAADAGYRLFWGISPQTKEKCLVYSRLPHWASLIYENLFELLLLIVASVFISLVLERYLLRNCRFVPTNPLTAFLYGALMPVCSCGILPLAARLRNRTGSSAMLALLVTGPLLSPQIIVLSLTVAGPVYTVSRILATLILALTSGLLIGRMIPEPDNLPDSADCRKGCDKSRAGTLSDTWQIVKGILPSAVLAGTLGMFVESFRPLEHIAAAKTFGSPFGVIAATLAGTPLYLCNGADIVFLRPLMDGGGLPLGTALAFSLSSSSICTASLVLMYHLLGKKTTIAYLIHIVAGTFLIGMLLNYLHP